MTAPSHPHPRPLLVLNPTDDTEFRTIVREMLDGATSPAVLQGRLREQHPRAVVRARGLSGEPAETWYVYRDGRWVGSGH